VLTHKHSILRKIHTITQAKIISFMLKHAAEILALSIVFFLFSAVNGG